MRKTNGRRRDELGLREKGTYADDNMPALAKKKRSMTNVVIIATVTQIVVTRSSGLRYRHCHEIQNMKYEI